MYYAFRARNKEAVRAAIAAADIVVHDAAALPLYPPADIYSTGIKGTQIMLEQTWHARIAFVIDISTTSVYGNPDHHPLLDDDPMSGVGP